MVVLSSSRPVRPCRVTAAAAAVRARRNNGKVKDDARTYAVGSRKYDAVAGGRAYIDAVLTMRDDALESHRIESDTMDGICIHNQYLVDKGTVLLVAGPGRCVHVHTDACQYVASP